jgi:hypothetical protein
MSGDSFESRSAEDRFLTPAQWTDFVRQAHAERQQAIEAAFASAFGGLRSAAARLAASTTGHAFARKDPAGDTAAWTQASHGKTKSI